MIWLILSLVAGAALYLALNKQQLSSTAVMTLAGVVAAIIGVLLIVMVKQAGLRAPGDDDAAVTGVELRDIDVGLDPSSPATRRSSSRSRAGCGTGARSAPSPRSG